MNKEQILALLKTNNVDGSLANIISAAIINIETSKTFIVGGSDIEHSELHDAEHYRKIYEARLRIKKKLSTEIIRGMEETVNVLRGQKGELKLLWVQLDEKAVSFWTNEDSKIVGCIVANLKQPPSNP